MLNEVRQALTGLPAGWAYAVLGAAVFAETALLLGVFVPTLTLMLTAGALARTGALDLPVVVTVAWAAAVGGDAVGHRTGRHLGARLSPGYPGYPGRRFTRETARRTHALVGSYRGPGVAACRFVPIARTLAPHLAGAAGLPYRSLAPYSVLAGLVWAGAEAGAGYAAAATLDSLTTWTGTLPTVLGAVIAVCALLVHLARRRRTRCREEG